ncbi:hypothetical protein LCGC14_1042910 [marine sediment metagenome]|uniref:Right handed beta helix domain-containing protein n=1 Tax=marine sediment metagenome TaxID=412755 RepID=A0A0F9QXI7_9ZZZZ
MTVRYVDSNAIGANNGTSWTDAWTALASADAAASTAGDEIRIAYNHVDATGGALVFSGGTLFNPVKLVSTDPADDTYRTGALFANNTGTISITGDVNAWGMTIRGTSDGNTEINLGTNNQRQYYCDCDFLWDDRPSFCIGWGTFNEFVNCTFDRNHANGEAMRMSGRGASMLFRNCTFLKTLGEDVCFGTWTDYLNKVTLEDCDLSAFSTIKGSISTSLDLILRRCKVKAGYTLVTTIPTTWPHWRALMEGCTDGTITVPELGLTEIQTHYGTIKSSLSRYRTGGADDSEQANAHSWEMVSSANALELQQWIKTPPMVRWVDGGASITVTVFIAGGATLQDDEFWIELSGPDDAGSATSRGFFERSNDTALDVPMTPRDTPANLTTDGSSTWNGTGVGTKQKLSVTYTPTTAGPVTVRALLAKASTTLYVDPKLEIS